ncbi:MAG: MMPL family transporter [Pseudomonadota bacterium]
MRKRLFEFIAHLATAHPKKIVAVAVILAIVSGFYAAAHIRLNSNLDELVSEKLDYHKRYMDFLKEFGDEEYLYVVVDASSDLPKAKLFLESLGARLKGKPDLTQVIWKIENPALERSFLLYLTPDQLKVLGMMLTQGPFAAKNIASWDGFAPMFGALASRIAAPVSTSDESELSTGFTFIDGLLDDMTAAIEKGDPYRSRLQSLFFGDGESFDPDGFLKNGGLLFMLIMPQKDYTTAAVIEEPLREIRSAIDATKAGFPGIDAGLTGRPVLNADEMETSNKDMTFATILALVLVAAVFVLFFRGIVRPLCAVATLVMGIAWTFGFIAIAVGTLNILSSVFALLLIGASIEYSIYIVARYEEELARTGVVADAIRRTLMTTVMAQLTSALTTAGAFLTLLWTDFLAIAQLGIISAAGILLCFVAMVVVLPALLVLHDRVFPAARLKKVRSFDLPGLGHIYRRPNWLFAGAFIVVAPIALFALRIGFDNNLLNLQARGLESVKYEHLIIEKSSETTWFARAIADTPQASHDKAQAFRALPSVRRVDDVERIVPENQKSKAAIVERMAPAFGGLTFTPVGDAVESRRLMFELGRLASGLERLEAQAFTSGRTDAVDELGKFAAKMRRLVDMIDGAGDDKLANLGRMQRAFFGDLRKNLEILASGMHPNAIALGDLPPDVAGRFVSPNSGRYSLYIYPRENIWDPPALARFVEEIRSVDSGAIGTPIEVHESGKLMRTTFLRSALLAFIVICCLVWLDFRTLRASALAVLTLVSGMFLLFGAMGIFGIQFNMANFFAIPILIGTGIDYGVQVVHRLRQERSFSAMGTSTGRALLMTVMANGIGFGTMMLAHHRGVASLGAILALGCLCCLVAAIVVTPPVARWFQWGHRHPLSSGEKDGMIGA